VIDRYQKFRFATLTLILVGAGVSIELGWPTLVQCGPPPALDPRHLVALPETSWGVALDLDGYTTSIDDLKSDGRRYLVASHPLTGLALTMTLDTMQAVTSADGCVTRLKQLAASPQASQAQDLALITTSSLPTLEYTVPENKPRPVPQRHVHLCYPKDYVYLNLHLSKASYAHADEDLFRTLLKTLQIVPVPPSQPTTGAASASVVGTSLDLFKAGNQFYDQSNYSHALVLYQQALDLDKANPLLDRITWRDLVDHLGMVYSIAGKLAQARAIFEYGIEEEHTYPLFHYHLACTFAEMNDRERTITSLRAAIRFRKHHNPGEPGVPDPRRDVTFRRFMSHKDFRAVVDRLMTQVQ